VLFYRRRTEAAADPPLLMQALADKCAEAEAAEAAAAAQRKQQEEERRQQEEQQQRPVGGSDDGLCPDAPNISERRRPLVASCWLLLLSGAATRHFPPPTNCSYGATAGRCCARLLCRGRCQAAASAIATLYQPCQPCPAAAR
jgi:hypothetical protein